jgi:hypothetical protein
MLRPTSFLLLGTFLAVVAEAKVAPFGLDEMWWHSDLVAVGRTVRVFESEGWRIAEFEVDRVLKGPAAPQGVQFLAAPTWTCDTSHGEIGERLLLFLGEATAELAEDAFFTEFSRGAPPTEAKGKRVYWISHWGRGRMPISARQRGESVQLMTADVILPESLSKQTFDASEYEIWSWLPLAAVEDYLRSLPLEPPTTTPTATHGPLPPEKLRP